MSNLFSQFTPSQPAESAPQPVAAPASQPRPQFQLQSLFNNKLALLGIFGTVMLVLALSLQLASRSRQPSDTTEPILDSGPEITGTDTITTDWPLYTDPYNSYEIKFPPEWSTNDNSSVVEQIKSLSVPNSVRFEIGVSQTKSLNLAAHLEDLDRQRSTLWEGRPSRSITSSLAVKVGSYDGWERTELISASGVEYLVSYVMIDDDIFSFSLIPTQGTKEITNKQLIRDYHLALTTFRVTNVADRLSEWKTYSAAKLESLAFPGYSLSFPATWAVSEQKDSTNQTLTVSRNGYKIIINQAAVGGAVCLFADSPAFQGSSGDLRNKEFQEQQTDAGYILRRYFKGNEGDSSIFLFCGKAEADKYFVTPLLVGGLTYSVPAKYDEGVLKEMDNIVKTLQPNTP